MGGANRCNTEAMFRRSNNLAAFNEFNLLAEMAAQLISLIKTVVRRRPKSTEKGRYRVP